MTFVQRCREAGIQTTFPPIKIPDGWWRDEKIEKLLAASGHSRLDDRERSTFGMHAEGEPTSDILTDLGRQINDGLQVEHSVEVITESEPPTTTIFEPDILASEPQQLRIDGHKPRTVTSFSSSSSPIEEPLMDENDPVVEPTVPPGGEVERELTEDLPSATSRRRRVLDASVRSIKKAAFWR